MRPKFLLPLAAILTLPLLTVAREETNENATTSQANSLSFDLLGYEGIPLEPNGRKKSWYVPLSLNGKPCKLLLDTGADFIILDSWVPERFGFATEPSEIKGMGVGGTSKLGSASILMTIGGKTVEKQHVRAKAEGDAAPAATIERPLAGMLGVSALHDVGAVLDFRRHMLWLPKQAKTKIDTLMESAHAAKIPLRHTAVSRHYYAEGTTGQQPLRMILDSGAEQTYLSAARAEAMKLSLTESNVRIEGGKGPDSRPKQGLLTDVAFGNAAMPSLPVLVLPLENVFAAISQGEPQPMDGILGLDVLEKGGAILDVGNDVLYLSGNAAGTPVKPPADTTGKAPIIDNHIVVPLERADGMQFLLRGKINGHDLRFAVDSGADSIIFHRPLAAELGVQLAKSEGSAHGADGKPQEVAVGKINNIELPGDMHIQNQSFPFIDLGNFTDIQIGGKPAKIGCLLGRGFIESTGMIIECSRNRVLIPTKGVKSGSYSTSLVGIGGQPVKLMRGAQGRFYMPVKLDGEDVALMIDTGASVSTLNPDYLEGKKWKREVRKEGGVQTLSQNQAGEIVTVPNAFFGPASLHSMQFVVVGHKEEAKVEGRRVVGLLGVNVLLPLKVVLDFGTAQAVFPPDTPPKK